jgi:hypothetical protein
MEQGTIAQGTGRVSAKNTENSGAFQTYRKFA